jgi:hypothetical protein
MVARTAERPRPRPRRRLRWLIVGLLAALAIVAYVQLTATEDTWRGLRGPLPFGDGQCAVALSPDSTVERTVCIAGGVTTCFDGRRQLSPARADCQGAREALVEEGLLPSVSPARS